MLQTNLFPPDLKIINGFIYVLHLRHLGGPVSPKSRTGMEFSPSCRGANGCSTIPKGSAVALRASEDAGILFKVSRAYLGDEFPWS